MDASIKNFLLGIAAGGILALLAFGFNRLSRRRDQKSEDERKALEAAKLDVEREKEKVRVLQGEVKELRMLQEAQNKAAIPITAAMEAMLLARLTNDHTPEGDALMKKQTDGTLTAADAIEFAKVLKHRSTDMDPRIDEAQRIAADILPGVIRLRELAEADEECEVKTVMVTVPETETKDAADGGTQEEEKGN